MLSSLRMLSRIFLPVLLILSPCLAEEPLRIGGETMGSYYSIVIDSPGSTQQDSLKAEIDHLLAEINRQMSTWSDTSEITAFNKSTSTDWIPVSTSFATVTEEAKRLHTVTGGCMDVTVAPLIEAWGFGRNKVRRTPTDQEIQAALKNVGMKQVEVRLDPPAIRKLNPRVTLNLSALAPGFAADEIGRLLTGKGLRSYVVDVGGENLAGQPKASGDLWRLGVESPLGGLHRVVELSNMAIATSGDYRNFFVLNGRKYSHILDPRNGRPVEHPPASISIIHPSCMTADGLATAMMVLGPEQGLQLAKSLNTDVLFLDLSEDGKLVEHATGLFLPPAEESP